MPVGVDGVVGAGRAVSGHVLEGVGVVMVADGPEPS